MSENDDVEATRLNSFGINKTKINKNRDPKMAASNCDKFMLLLWKNWILQFNRKAQLIVELCIPIVFSLLLILIRSAAVPDKIEKVTFPPQNISNLLNLQKTLAQGAFYRKLFRNRLLSVSFNPELAYSPSNKILDGIISAAARSLGIQYKALPNSKALEVFLTSGNGSLSGVEFDDTLVSITDYPEELSYALRFPSELRTYQRIRVVTWMTNKIFPIFFLGGPRNQEDADGGSPVGYIQEGFIPIQHAISTAFIRLTAKAKNIPDKLPQVVMQRYPYPAYMNDPILIGLQSIIAFIMLISFIYPCTILVKSITLEKEKQLKEVMKIMGLQNWLHWSAWFVKSFLMMGITVIIIVILMKVKFVNDTSVLSNTSWSTLIIFLLVYVVTTITFCFMIATFFSRASTAAASTGLILFVSYLPYAFTDSKYDDLSLPSKLVLCLLLNTGLGFGFKLIVLFEGVGEGLQWSNLFKPVSVDDNLTVGYIILMMLLASVLQMIICLYIEQIFPGEFGVRKVWYFPFTQNFWFGENKYKGIEDNSYIQQTKTLSDGFEEEPTGKHIGLQVKNLRKDFKKKVAVQGVSLNMYEDEITVLLGHNGAGKTTTISMITGMFPPTSGTAIINGNDIRTNMEGARMSMGLCPQHNILFDDFTVRNHIVFYSRLKGVKRDAINNEVDKYLKKIGLEQKENVKSSKLSGGMKRKLSLCAALCGGTKVVLCDEPSSGMDPAARRQLWDLLQSEKSGRTILLTTHFMDEADVLGDRIAIMCDGEVKCHGTSFFLKKRFGSGYRLICVKKPNCDSSAVTALLQTYIPNLKTENEIGTELVYLLPDEYSKDFELMFSDLESHSESLELNGFGISITSLEEVFMKVGAENSAKSENIASLSILSNNNVDDDIESISSETINSTNNYLLTGMLLLRNQWIAMFIKKYLYTIRNKISLAIQILVPVVFAILTITIGRTKGSFKLLTPLKIDFNSYDETFTILETANNVTNGSVELKISDAYQLMMTNKPTQHELTTTKTDFQQFIFDLSKTMLVRINRKCMASATVSKDYIIAWFNNQAYHTAPLSLNLVHNAMAKGVLGPSYSIEVTNFPLPYTAETKIQNLNNGNNLGAALATNLCFSMCFVAALYVLFVIKERECRAKLLQFVGGVQVFTFWLTQLLWDMLIFIITSLIIVLTIVFFQEDGYSTSSQIGRVFFIFIIFGLAVMPITYVLSHCFSDSSTGFAVLSIFNVLTGFALSLVMRVLSIEELGATKTAKKLQWIFMIFPHFCFANSLDKLYQNYQTRKICDQIAMFNFKIDCNSVPYFSWKDPGVLRQIIYMILCFLIVFFFLLIKEFRYLEQIMFKLKNKKRTRTQPSEDRYYDEDVENEKLVIQNMNQEDIMSENLVLDRVTKYYGKFLAVNEISVCIKKSECFGLLGVNGAGKTTTFKMMTGDERISSGDAYVCGYNLKSEMKNVYKEIGYCPQFDGLLDDLTGRETLKIFCLIRGVRENRISSTSENLAKVFGFSKHLDKPTKVFSGGTKRKLSTSIAVIGNPSVIFLDEPTTGMDPAARRQLWNMIIGIRHSGKSIVLTTHSMEECEALCTRLAIMVNGEFKCIGSTQHLKNKFSKGLILKIKVKRTPISRTNLESWYALETSAPLNDTTAITEFIQNEFPEAILQEQRQELLTFYIPLLTIKWSRIFGLIEANLDKLNIEDYSISQTTLEEIFLDFAKFQTEDPRDVNRK